MLIAQSQIQARLADAYTAGQLDAGMRLLVETQAILRPAQDLAMADAVAGALLERETPAPMKADALASVFAKIDALPPRPLKSEQFLDEVMKLPAPIRAAALESLETRGWKFGGPGIRILQLALENSALTELVRVEPGFAAPNHTHDAGEFTLVLTGALLDERGRYAVGDIAYADASVTHTPKAEHGDVCWNLAISEAPLVLTGPLGLIQKLLPN